MKQPCEVCAMIITNPVLLILEFETQFAATLSFAVEIITLSEVSQKEKNTIWYHLHVESKI